jgi:hypothetical protein
MTTRRPEVADVLRAFGPAYREAFHASFAQEHVLTQLSLCRTASLGGHKLQCDSCGHQEISYNSCRNRHCPKCRASAPAQWLADRERDLLEVPYFHVVFTLPNELSAIALQNKRLCYGLLFSAAAKTLQTIAADPKHLGARIGFLAVLHTWSQTLLHHPHLHCVVPGGGLAPDQNTWIPCPKHFFLPVKVLSRLFRRLYLEGLQAAFEEQELELHGQLKPLRELANWRDAIARVRHKEWIVYAKPPFGGPLQVLKYLARYTHRVAISNGRLLTIEDDHVRFRYKDRSSNSRSKVMKVTGVEFIRRFLLHVLPKGFVRIRSFGFLCNCCREQKLQLIRTLLEHQPDSSPAQEPNFSNGDTDQLQPVLMPGQCPRCECGRLLIVEKLPPGSPQLHDSS